MELLDSVGLNLGRRYGDVQELCPAQEADNDSPYCVYRDGQRAGVNNLRFAEQGSGYIQEQFEGIWRLRILRAQLEAPLSS